MGCRVSQMYDEFDDEFGVGSSRYYRKMRPEWTMVHHVGFTNPKIDNSKCRTMTCQGRAAFDKLPEAVKTSGQSIISNYMDECLAARMPYDLTILANVFGPDHLMTSFVDLNFPREYDHTTTCIDPVYRVKIYYDSGSRPIDMKDTYILLVDLTKPVTLKNTNLNDCRTRVLVGINGIDGISGISATSGTPPDDINGVAARKFAQENNMLYFQDVGMTTVVRTVATIQRSLLCCHYCQLMAQIGSCPNKGCPWCRVGVYGYVF